MSEAEEERMTSTTDVKYENKSVKTIRGMEARTRAKYEKEGWEFVSQSQGKVRSELKFRRSAPKIPWKWIGIGGGVIAILILALVLFATLGGKNEADELAAAYPSQTAAASPTPTIFEPAPTESSEPAPIAPVVTEITVDELLDKLNSTDMGGIKVGDQFHLTGELFMSDLWMTGASGDYFVMLKAQAGAQDLSVFVDESGATGWQDGTQVDMVVEMVEATINGETTDGWLRARSVTTI